MTSLEPWVLRRLAKHELTDADKAWCRSLARWMQDVTESAESWGAENAVESTDVARYALSIIQRRVLLDPHGISRGAPMREAFDSARHYVGPRADGVFVTQFEHPVGYITKDGYVPAPPATCC